MRAVVHHLTYEGRETSPPLSRQGWPPGHAGRSHEATNPHFPDSWLQQNGPDHRDSRPHPASSFPSELLV